MKPIAALAVVSALGLSSMAAAAEPQAGGSKSVEQSHVRGQVFDAEQNPVPEAEVVLRTEEGREIARARTDTSGAYSMGCVDLGKYRHQVSAPGYEGHEVVAPLGPNGLTVSWAVDANEPALASATASGGPCVDGQVAAASPTGAVQGPAGASGASGAGTAAGATTAESAAATLGAVAVTGGISVGTAAAAGTFDSEKSRPVADTPVQ